MHKLQHTSYNLTDICTALMRTSMKKILIPFVLFSLTAYGQKYNDKIKSTIENSRTSEHINIPGTRLFIIPPPALLWQKHLWDWKKAKIHSCQFRRSLAEISIRTRLT